ncbi:glycosyltransferase family 39 protein [Capillimicrobium parvum]|uniref:Glycosyltransferase RgtA/B/C/D-like domain-containing protein n=1 Tax=Capillimicrobium parvum TaxID=2884022 RepID=A0A9E7C0R8_9ACTN|nr:glycosyltransferase family 39 protein [Capillimicrobium parvum]UGS35817.1 hypothetical protein DSM104329_02213 [Capillimicrobium parvum]
MSRPDRLRAEAPALALLLLMLAVGLFLRIHNNDYGLPFVYYADEGSHFTNRAVGMLGGDANPHYFQNPSAFTYIVHVALRFYFGHGWPFGDFQHVIDAYGEVPTRIYEIGRTMAALVCAVGIVGIYFVGRALWSRAVGLVSAAVLCFAFLIVAYSRIAVTDVGTLLPVALALWCAVRIHERGGLRWYAGAGAAVGLAVGFKYTAGLVVLSPLLAVALGWHARREANRTGARLPPADAASPPRSGLAGVGTPGREALLGLGLMLVLAVAVFFVTTPYFFLDLSTAEHQLRHQADLAGGLSKYGQEHDNGFLYYAWSLTWGLGWLPLAAALGGLVLMVRDGQRARAVLLAIFPLAMYLYLATQQRYFGRWFLPAYPAFALLAGFGAVRAIALVRRIGPRLAPAAIAVLAGVLVWQAVAADFRSMAVLGHTDTRQVARDWLEEHQRQSLRIVIEPGVPARYYWKLRSNGTHVPRRKQFVRGFIRDISETRIEYGRTLSPAVIDRYRKSGFCLVMTMSLIRGRSVNARNPKALAYYDRLERESKKIFSVSPFRFNAGEDKFNFDLSYNYYSPAYLRPGPQIDVYRLDGCTQGYGQVEQGVGTPEGAGTS